jgi:hypothetical protein
MEVSFRQMSSSSLLGKLIIHSSLILVNTSILTTHPRLSQPRDVIRPIFGDEVADKSTQMWGLSEEGEVNGCYRDIGFKGLYNIMGEQFV